MDDYGKEALKERYKDDLNEVYKEMLKEEEKKLEEINEEWNERKTEALKSIAYYDVAMAGGINQDVNTMNVDIITNIQHFKEVDIDTNRKKKVKDMESNIFALKGLIR